MLREIIKPSNNTYTLNLPDELVGKTIEVIAFEIEETALNADMINIDSSNRSIKDIRKRYSVFPMISHDNFKFDRDEANDYSE